MARSSRRYATIARTISRPCARSNCVSRPAGVARCWLRSARVHGHPMHLSAALSSAEHEGTMVTQRFHRARERRIEVLAEVRKRNSFAGLRFFDVLLYPHETSLGPFRRRSGAGASGLMPTFRLSHSARTNVTSTGVGTSRSLFAGLRRPVERSMANTTTLSDA